MSEKKEAPIRAVNSAVSMPKQENECPVLVEKIGKTTYWVRVHFSITSQETMSDKIKRMLRNEVSRL